jgi:hypothetical protein
MMRQRIVTLICVALVTSGILLLIAGGLPYERMQSFGALVRRADDFTPERYARYRHVCWFFAAALPALAYVLWRRECSRNHAADCTLAVSQLAVERPPSANWLLWLIVAVGFGLRWQRLFDPVAYDEAYTYLNFASRPWYEAIGDYNSTNNHLLNTLLMHVSTRIFGPQEWAMRWHVLLVGSVLPITVYMWGKEWLGRGVGLIAAAAVAVSPMLITYSTDARGYMLVALAAIVFDLSLGRLARNGVPLEPRGPAPLEPRGLSPRPIDWWLAWGTLVFGLCSMPLMVYPAVGSAAWFVCTSYTDGRSRRVVLNRIRTLAGLGVLALPVVAAFYAPAYIFRGLMFLRDPVVQPAAGSSYLTELAAAWSQAYGWWTEGLFLRWLWAPFALLGLAVMPSNSSRLRWCLPFVAVLLLNIVQHVAPPPRIYMHLAPWIFVAAGLGIQWISKRLRSTSRFKGTIPALILLGAGSFSAYTRPVLFNVSERADFQSVPEAIARIQLAANVRHGHIVIVLAPLPCDLPSIFYLRRNGGELPVNVRPEPGELVYLIARPNEKPQQALETPLLNMADLAPQFDDWHKVAEFQTLTLYVSLIPADRR